MQDNERKTQRDRELGMDRPITRRDFLNGVAFGIGAAMVGSGLGPLACDAEAAAFAQDAPGYYPPALTGMRGSHDGSFDVSHALRDGRSGERRRRRERTAKPTIWSSWAAASAVSPQRTSTERARAAPRRS